MELRVLKYFLTVAREENITRAASLLHMTQPTLSRQLHQLEEELGIRLFTRLSHRIVLTEDGLLLRTRAQAILDLAEKTKREFASDAESLAGDIVIGCGETHNMQPLAQWIKSFRRLHPLVTFQFQSAIADVVQGQIENGLLDMGILMEPVDIARYEILRLPIQERWGVFVAEDSALAAKETVEPEDLIGQPIILPFRDSVQTALRSWLMEVYDEMQVVAHYNLIYNAGFLAQQGVGAVFCYETIPYIPGIVFRPLKGMPPVGGVLVWKRQQTFSKATRKFLAHCQKCSQMKS